MCKASGRSSRLMMMQEAQKVTPPPPPEPEKVADQLADEQDSPNAKSLGIRQGRTRLMIPRTTGTLPGGSGLGIAS